MELVPSAKIHSKSTAQSKIKMPEIIHSPTSLRVNGCLLWDIVSRFKLDKHRTDLTVPFWIQGMLQPSK